MSDYLTEKIGKIDLKNKELAIGLIDDEVPNWINTIKGDEKNNYYPAEEFFYDIIPNYLSEYKFIQQLILPEAKINDIARCENKEFINQQVDFYLEQAKLVIEIDGSHHKDIIQRELDNRRDIYLNKLGIITKRITTNEIKSKNESFEIKINEIKDILNKNESRFVLYKNKKNKYTEEEKNIIKASQAIRIQILILSLLEKDILSLDDESWKINILSREKYNLIEESIEDLFLWFENICVLDNIVIDRPKLDIKVTYSENEFSYKKGYINIDFSLNKRYTDENESNKEVIYVRTDYYNKQNYFRVSTTDPICYKLEQENDSCKDALKFLLKNIYGFDEFRTGQLPIIINSLKGEDTVGILPTGTGKSLCYQLVGLLQPCVNFIVCPIKSLMYDQVQNLKKIYINNINTVTSDDEGSKKEEIIKSFSNGEYQFIFISPERFQSKKFRESLSNLNTNSTLGLAVIDEVHCLSEWGHDFRTSYLNLAKTIRNYAPSTRLLGLTATASNFVLKDIQREFEIDNYNIKTTASFNREELNFEVITTDNKRELLFSKLEKMDKEESIFELNEENTKSGIIFTPHVNGKKGCYPLSLDISRKFGIKCPYYSGSKPKDIDMSEIEFNREKNNMQMHFKLNRAPLLVATKAFGMGVDKPNIRYTIHYGIPMTLESLYQEAGRAGRDKKPANCYVLYEPEIIDEKLLNKFFSLDIPVEDLDMIQKSLKYDQKKDVLGNFYLWLSNNKGIDYEFDIINAVYNMYAKPNAKKLVYCRELGFSKGDVEKAIYRLSIMGIVNDWTIESWDSTNSVIEVEFNDYDIDFILETVEKYIQKYEKEFSFESILENKNIKETYNKMLNILLDKTIDGISRIIRAVLIWVYDNIIYNRRQSMKNIMELCDKYENSNTFREAIESYFKFDDDTYTLDYIAENPTDYKKWFEVLLDKEGNLELKKARALKGSIGRFLESYRYNTGLNFISGIVRLIENNYDNVDGKQRLEDSFSNIAAYSEEDKEEILDFCLNVGKQLDKENRENLSEVLCKHYSNLLKINECLEDDTSLTFIIEDRIKRLNSISRRVQCQQLQN